MNKNIKTLSLVLLMSSAALVTVVTRAEFAATPTKTSSVAKASDIKKGDLNVGVVSATEIMMETDMGKEASKAIDAKRQNYMKQAQVRAQDIEKKEKDLIAKASTMSPDSQRKASTEIANLKQDLDADQKKWMQDLQLDAQAEMEKLGREFDSAVQKIAKESNIDLIFELESGRIVFAADNLKKTDLVKTAMNSNHKATQVAAAKKDKATA